MGWWCCGPLLPIRAATEGSTYTIRPCRTWVSTKPHGPKSILRLWAKEDETNSVALDTAPEWQKESRRSPSFYMWYGLVQDFQWEMTRSIYFPFSLWDFLGWLGFLSITLSSLLAFQPRTFFFLLCPIPRIVWSIFISTSPCALCGSFHDQQFAKGNEFLLFLLLCAFFFTIPSPPLSLAPAFSYPEQRECCLVRTVMPRGK